MARKNSVKNTVVVAEQQAPEADWHLCPSTGEILVPLHVTEDEYALVNRVVFEPAEGENVRRFCAASPSLIQVGRAIVRLMRGHIRIAEENVRLPFGGKPTVKEDDRQRYTGTIVEVPGNKQGEKSCTFVSLGDNGRKTLVSRTFKVFERGGERVLNSHPALDDNGFFRLQLAEEGYWPQDGLMAAGAAALLQKGRIIEFVGRTPLNADNCRALIYQGMEWEKEALARREAEGAYRTTKNVSI